MDTGMCRFIKLAIVLTALISKTALSAISSGQITIINGLANGVNTGATATSISVQVYDSMGVCSTARTVVFNGSLVIKWDVTRLHSVNQCTGITSVAITPLRTIIGSTSTIIYDSTTTTHVPATNATSAINYLAPTVATANLVLLVTGTGIPASTQTVSGTSWGIGAAAIPVFNASNGDLVTVGVPGGMGMAGLR